MHSSTLQDDAHSAPHRTIRRPTLPNGRSMVGAALITLAMVAAFALANTGGDRPTTRYAVATKPIAPGTRLDASMLELRALQLDPDLAQQSFSDLAAVIGAVALGPIGAGQLVAPASVAPATRVNGEVVLGHEVTIPVAKDRIPSNLRRGERIAVLAEGLLFLDPQTQEQIAECRVGAVWSALLEAIDGASWSAISHNLIGFLYEAIVDTDYRHALGQHYTQENLVDFLTAYSIVAKGDVVLDPAAGGGSFLRSAYGRKRALGATHHDALAQVWGCELSSFAAELSTVTLATADPSEPSAYPRVVVTDFFDLRPKAKTKLELPDVAGPLKLPEYFDAVVGNPPYIAYRYQTNQAKILKALGDLPHEVALPRLSGKSDEYAWFLVHATRFLCKGGRLGFVVSSAILFADYGLPLIRFLAKHYRIRAVVDSMVERWFVDADTNTVLLLLERETDAQHRIDNEIRFVRLRRPLSQLLPPPLSSDRRDELETLIDTLLAAPSGDADPRFTCVTVRQGEHGGIAFVELHDGAASLLDDESEEDE